MTRSEIFTLMTSGMATIAGTVMVLYASILSKTIPDVMGHILTASIISVPAAVTIAKIMVPETGTVTTGRVEIVFEAVTGVGNWTLVAIYQRDDETKVVEIRFRLRQWLEDSPSDR